eukprot:gene5861-1045_t
MCLHHARAFIMPYSHCSRTNFEALPPLLCRFHNPYSSLSPSTSTSREPFAADRAPAPAEPEARPGGMKPAARATALVGVVAMGLTVYMVLYAPAGPRPDPVIEQAEADDALPALAPVPPPANAVKN